MRYGRLTELVKLALRAEDAHRMAKQFGLVYDPKTPARKWALRMLRRGWAPADFGAAPEPLIRDVAEKTLATGKEWGARAANWDRRFAGPYKGTSYAASLTSSAEKSPHLQAYAARVDAKLKGSPEEVLGTGATVDEIKKSLVRERARLKAAGNTLHSHPVQFSDLPDGFVMTTAQKREMSRRSEYMYPAATPSGDVYQGDVGVYRRIKGESVSAKAMERAQSQMAELGNEFANASRAGNIDESAFAASRKKLDALSRSLILNSPVQDHTIVSAPDMVYSVNRIRADASRAGDKFSANNGVRTVMFKLPGAR